MTLFRGRYRVESARCPTWDYTNPGWYFITFVTANRQQWLARIEDGEAIPSTAGRIVAEEWVRIAVLRPAVQLGPVAIMPDHVHGLIGFMDHRSDLGRVIGQTKAVCTRRIRQSGVPDFGWQERYHDRIVRDPGQWDRLVRYVRENAQHHEPPAD